MPTDSETGLIYDYYLFVYHDPDLALKAADKTCDQIDSHAQTFREFAKSALKRTDLPEDLEKRFEDAL
jgi:hypothetical protein